MTKRQTLPKRNPLLFLGPGLFLTALLTIYPLPLTGEEFDISFQEEGASSILALQDANLDQREHTSRVLLAENGLQPDRETDLLLDFNRKPLREQTGQYSITQDNIRLKTRDPFLEGGTAIFQEESSGIVLSPKKSTALFAAENIWKDFSFEFWLYPANLKDGETLFLWRGVRWKNQEEFFSQEIRCSFINRKLVWTFDNVFLPPGQEEFSLSIEPEKALIPRQWHHHLLRFNTQTGLLEYLVDGIPEAAAYANRENRETGNTYLPYTGKAGRDQITLGQNFTGLLDDFRISRTCRSRPELSRYREDPGTMITTPLDMKYANSSFQSLTVQEETPGETDIFYFYRIADRKDQLMSPLSEKTNSGLGPEWKPLRPETTLDSDNRGRYLQIKAVLYTNGKRDLSPEIHRLRIQYEPDLPPPAPTGVQAENRDGSVKVDWNHVNEDDIAGYKVYYGTKPGHYFGTAASEGSSPVDAGESTSITLHDLEEYRLYYFSVVSYDQGVGQESPYSRETSARPQRTEE